MLLMLMNRFQRQLIYLIEMVLYNVRVIELMVRHNSVVLNKDQRVD